MGITSLSLERINKHIKPNDSLLILGCQNLYDAEHYGQVAADYFQSLGHVVKDIDIYECNGCQIQDLRKHFDFGQFDMVLDHGTYEHIDGSLHTPLLNIHNACNVGGIMIHENPLTDNWPGHGQHYFTPDFWYNFAKTVGYELLENTTEAAMGNITDGWNSCAVLRKTNDREFITEEQFKLIYDKYIKAS